MGSTPAPGTNARRTGGNDDGLAVEWPETRVGHPDVVQGLAHGEPSALGVRHIDGNAQVVELPGQGYDLVLIVGEDEVKEGKIVLKDFATGTQEKYDINEILNILKK